MNLLIVTVTLAAATICEGQTCWKNDVSDCTMHATHAFFYAGKNMAKLCAAGETYLKCLNSLISCSSSYYYFDAIRILNSRVTIDDCPGLLNLTINSPPVLTG